MSSRRTPRTSCAHSFRRAGSRSPLPSNLRFAGSGVRVSEKQGTKRCSRCGKVVPRAAFARDEPVRDGSQSYCRETASDGLSGSRRDGLIASPGGVCRVCPAVPDAHVDHCHETGRVRGVPCLSRNAALGQFKDQPEAIRRAAAYVEGNAWKPTLVAPGVCQLPS
ncbi:endonuclease VII domain-containing protein [Streptomyces sp. NPDC051452]|uniref:endonuclease VII domain-containing protein n=1 Tax=Streptomyces sp. NPDC051452 TaxID=3365654 RepID=UPI00379AB60D